MNSFYKSMLENYKACTMNKNINERSSLIEFSENNSELFLRYNTNFKNIKRLGDSAKWKQYTKYKYKNIRTTLERNISVIDCSSFNTSECKYCGQLKEEREIEHVLPKANYPEFAIFVPNLICVCGTCNKKKPDEIPMINNINMYPHPRYELYTSFVVEIVLIYQTDYLHNEAKLIYSGNDEVVERWNRLRDDLNLNKRISDNVVKIECDMILKLLKRGKTVQHMIEKYKIKLADEEYSTELEKQIFTGLIKALADLEFDVT